MHVLYRLKLGSQARKAYFTKRERTKELLVHSSHCELLKDLSVFTVQAAPF